jgi:hypothetical protein
MVESATDPELTEWIGLPEGEIVSVTPAKTDIE